MSERDDNERILREGIEAYNRGDVEAIVALFDPQIELHVDAAQGNPGTWIGLDGFQQMMSGWRDAFAEDRSELRDVEMVGDSHLIAEMRQTAIGSASGIPVEMTNYYLLELRDGRAVRFHIYGDRETAMAAVRK
jgi:ketosteroid isomerase-like protein